MTFELRLGEVKGVVLGRLEVLQVEGTASAPRGGGRLGATGTARRAMWVEQVGARKEG